jgi:hypothetical protein
MLPAVIQQVHDSTTEDPYLGNPQSAVMISEHLNIKVSHETINRIRGLLHYKYKTPYHRPAMAPVHVQNRMDFCTEALNGTINWAGDVIITDESRFSLTDDSR